MKTIGLHGEEEKPRYRRNFLLAENAVVYLVLRRNKEGGGISHRPPRVV